MTHHRPRNPTTGHSSIHAEHKTHKTGTQTISRLALLTKAAAAQGTLAKLRQKLQNLVDHLAWTVGHHYDDLWAYESALRAIHVSTAAHEAEVTALAHAWYDLHLPRTRKHLLITAGIEHSRARTPEVRALSNDDIKILIALSR
jgi:hypothetical protein